MKKTILPFAILIFFSFLFFESPQCFSQQVYSATDSVIVPTSGGSSNFGRGFRFKPTQDMWVVRLGKRVPSAGPYTWAIWDMATQVKVFGQTSLLDLPGQYIYEDADSIIKLNVNQEYILELYGTSAAATYYYGSSSQAGPHIQYMDQRYCNSCTPNTFPTSVLTNLHYGTPDFIYTLISPQGGLNDAALTGPTAPLNFCSGTQDIKVMVHNFGGNQIDSVKIGWTLDGVAQPSYSLTTPLDTIGGLGINDIEVNLGSHTFTAAAVAFKAWTYSPNGVADTVNANDTIVFNFQANHFFVEAVSDSICVGGEAILSLNPNTGYNVGDLQWQNSTNGTTWTSIPNTDDVDYSESNVLANKYFRVKIGSGTGFCYSDSLQVVVVPVATPTVVSGERCGPGSVDLSATSSVGNTLKWYDVITGGVPIATTPIFTTPNLSATTDYWVSSAFGTSGADSLAVPLTIGNTTGIYHHMFLVHSIAGLTIKDIGIKCNNSVNTMTAWDVYYRPDNYQLVPGANTSANGWILLSSTTNVPSLGSNAYTEIASGFSLDIPPNTTYSIYIAPVGGATHQYYSPAIGTVTASDAFGEIRAGNRGSSLFNVTSSGGQAVVKLGFATGCESPRQMVTATIKPQPVVDLGNDTAVCSNASLSLDAGNVGSAFLWNNNSTSQTLNITTAGIYSVTVTGTNLCVYADTIDVAVGIAPLNNLPATVDLCFGDTITLDAGNAGSTYLWSNAETTQTADINTAGSYDVLITSPDGCPLNSSTTIVSRPLPIVDLGADTAICSGVQIVLDAGNPGFNYLWNSGITTQTEMVSNPGDYSVTVTSQYDCHDADTITITTLPSPTTDGFDFIPMFNEQLGKVEFFAINPQNVTGYKWDFGDGTADVTIANPIHTYASTGIYTTTLTVSNECGDQSLSLTLNVQTVGITKIAGGKIDFSLYPNPTRNELILENKSEDASMQQISIFNVLGSVVYERKTDNNKMQVLDVSKLASGIYTVRILTNKGLVIKKFEVIK